MQEFFRPMLQLLKPFEDLAHYYLKDGPLHNILFQIFKIFHLYLYEYVDYFIFAVFAIPLFYFVPKKARLHYLLFASFAMISLMHGFIFSICLLGFPLCIHFLVKHWQKRAIEDDIFRKKATKGLVYFVITVYLLLLAREHFLWSPTVPIVDMPLIVPLVHFAGIAFMLPKLIHYIVDSFNGKITIAKTSHFALFMIFFPIFRLGPIERFQNFQRDIWYSSENGVSRFDIGYGLYRITLGIIKSIIFTSVLYPWRLWTLQHMGEASWFWIQWMVFVGTLEAYFHFGGYSDIAIGFSRLLGFKTMENFYFPFLARNIGEMWRRWHISLSFWLRDYVFIPLGGSKSHGIRNALITFFICGIWHDIAWKYIFWGTMQGVALAWLGVWQRFWYQVEHVKNFMNPLKPVKAFFKNRPRLSYALGVWITLEFFGITGTYSVIGMEKATYAFLRLITFGWYVQG